MMFKSFLSLFALATAVSSAAVYDHEVKLDDQGRYILRWKIVDDRIDISIDAATTGWVGFGISPSASMLNADMVVAYVDDAGVTHADDRNTLGFTTRAMPALDKSQDWQVSTASAGTESNGRTTVHLSRKLRTCDAEDIDIPTGTARVIWAIGTSDPSSPGGSFSAHSVFGKVSLDLLSRDPRTVTSVNQITDADAETVEVALGASRVAVPSDRDTYYHCRGVDLGAASVGRHLIASGISVEAGNERHVHHVLMYECPGDLGASDVSFDGACSDNNMPDSLGGCRGGKPVVAWAIGGEVLVMPDGYGIPLGSRYFVLETHYDNPTKTAGVTDLSKVQMLLRKGDKPMAKEAQIFTVGAIPAGQLIPPGEKAVQHSFVCPSACTSTWSGPAKVFGVFHHGHLAATQIQLRHYRDGRELAPISVDMSYDFNLQTFRRLPEPVTIQPGDTLNSSCTYDTTARSSMTYGGDGTSNEMCLNYLIAEKIGGASQVCWSYPNPSEYLNEFGAYLVTSGKTTQSAAVKGLTEFADPKTSEARRNEILASLGVTWTPEQSAAFTRAYTAAKQYSPLCPSTSASYDAVSTDVPYVPPPVCAGDPTPFPDSTDKDGEASSAAATAFATAAAVAAAIAVLM